MDTVSSSTWEEHESLTVHNAHNLPSISRWPPPGEVGRCYSYRHQIPVNTPEQPFVRSFVNLNDFALVAFKRLQRFIRIVGMFENPISRHVAITSCAWRWRG